MERLSLKGHTIRVIDYPINWQKEKYRSLISKRTVYEGVSRFYPGSKVTVVRPAIVKLPLLDKLSIPFTHRKEISRQIDEFKPDVVVGLGILNNYFAIREAKKAGIPFIYYLIDTLHRLIDNGVYQFIAKEFEKNNIKNSTHVLAINKKLMEYALEMGGDRDHASVIPAGIDLEFFKSPAKLDRYKYGLEKDDFVLFFMGWLYAFTGVLEIAEALVKNNYDRVKLLVVGEGDVYPSLVNIAKTSDKIIVIGKVPYSEIPSLLSMADVCILPAYNIEVMQDIVPIKIYEYLASGKPVLSTELPGIKEEFGIDGGIIFVKDNYDLIKHANYLMNDKIYKKYSSKAVNSIKSNDWSNITSIFEDLLINNTIK